MVVRNLKQSLLKSELASSREIVSKPQKRTRVGVLISGTGLFSFYLHLSQIE